MGAKEEKIIEVQKNYSEEVIQEIQNAVNSKMAVINVLTNISELPKVIVLDQVKLSLTTINGLYDSCLYFDSGIIDKNTWPKWKTEPIYKFYFKDWKRLNKDVNIFENDNYIEIHFNVKDAEIVALLRRIDIELKDDSFNLMEYGHIFYNGGQYTIIKAYVENLNESYSVQSILENANFKEKIYDNNGNEVIIDEFGKVKGLDDSEGISEISINDIPDMESEELF